MNLPPRPIRRSGPPPRKGSYCEEGDGLDQLLSQSWKDKANGHRILHAWMYRLPPLLSPAVYRINPGLDKRAWESLDLMASSSRDHLAAIRFLALAYQRAGADPGGSAAFCHYALTLEARSI